VSGPAWEEPLGALPQADGTTVFRVWAPRAEAVAVRLDSGDHALEPAGEGVFAGRLPAAPGDDYRLVLDGADAWPDPFSRWQPEGVLGPSRVLDLDALTRTIRPGRPVPPKELVLYELHVGTFTAEGTFDAAIGRLEDLRELGVTAIELMPVATFPGDRNWGYDGLYTFAPHPAYGGPEGLARLVDAAHEAGIAVLLDVVYNHLGPGNEAIEAFGPFMTGRYGTPWGKAVNYDGPDSGAVREWAIRNALQWIAGYRMDGLRLDAVHAIFDAGARPMLAELCDRVRAAAPGVLLVAESDRNDPRTIRPVEAGGLGFDAQWADEFHHALHVLLTGERDGYYADFGAVAQLAKAFRRPFVYDGGYSAERRRRHGAPAFDREPWRFVVFGQNHDQVGNRAFGDRLPDEALRLAAFCTLLSPFTPMLWMGEEYGERRPFQFFTDHVDPFIADATREGRRREFAHFAAFAGEVPDPQDVATFERSTLEPGGGDPALLGLYRRLIALRPELAPECEPVAADEQGRTLRLRRGDIELLANFAPAPARIATDGSEIVLSTHDGVELSRGEALLPARAGAAVRCRR
jgi:maltooligosyltrehalose trehalohydrolase